MSFLGGGKDWTVGDVSGFAVEAEELLVVPEPLESSPGEFAGPGRLVLSTLAMIVYVIGNTPTSSTTTTKSPRGSLQMSQ